jgi:hypothetical protein
MKESIPQMRIRERKEDDEEDLYFIPSDDKEDEEEYNEKSIRHNITPIETESTNSNPIDMTYKGIREEEECKNNNNYFKERKRNQNIITTRKTKAQRTKTRQ